MTIKKKEKQSIHPRERLRLGILIVLVLAAIVYLVPKSANTHTDSTLISEAPLPSAAPQDARSARESAYDKDIAALERLIGNESADEDTRAQASESLARMIADHHSELGIEEALTQAGFKPCLVLMQNGSLTVMVSERELSGEQTVTILSICAAHSDIGIENMRIMTGEEL